ncbi:MAG: TIGR02117 family protein [Spongiibacteraceae bacterium]|nr:TIGR02117 family protein [Spongiibacteraceae bacterium]
MKSIAVIFVLLMLVACSSKPSVVVLSEQRSMAPSTVIYVVSHGWHTGLIVPADDLQERIPELKKRFSDTHYLELGWGDKGFYQAKEITAGLVVQAIFWPTKTVVHTVAVPSNVRRYFSNSDLKQLRLNGKEYSSLLQFISNSFYKEQGSIVELKNGIYGDSQFYRGVGDYYLMNTCNKWTAKGLKSAGVDIVPTFKLTAGSVMDYIDRWNQKTLSSPLP